MNPFHSLRIITGLAVGVGLTVPVLADEQAQRDSRRSAQSRADEEPKLDLNTAEREDLAAVAVIGEDGAQAIIAARPFARIDDLDRIRGLSAERLEQIRTKVTVSPDLIPEKVLVEEAEIRQSAPANPDDRKQVDINTADLKTLASIPSIGPKTAQDIVAERPFATVDELMRLPGISAERLELIRTRAKVAPRTAPPESAR